MANSPTVRPVCIATGKPADLSALGFRDINPEIAYRVIASTVAGEKSGKTHFAMTAPGPVAVISTDTGTEPVARRFFRSKKIHLRPFTSAKDIQQDGGGKRDGVKEWEAMKGAIEGVYDNRSIRTLVIDTGTEAWELCRLARLGKLTQVMPHHYVEVNSEFTTLVKAAYQRNDLNVIWIHKTKKEYKTNASGKDNWTGRMERAGFGDMPFIVDVNIKQYFNQNRKDPFTNEDLSPAFCAQILDSRESMLEAVGTVLEGDLCNFQMLAEILFPETIGVGMWD